MSGVFSSRNIKSLFFATSTFVSSGLWASQNYAFTSYSCARPVNQECFEDSCFDLQKISYESLLYGYERKEKEEQLYRARLAIGQAMGQLIPMLNVSSFVGFTPASVINVVPFLIGFMFPSNWFNWSASKKFFEAEKEQYKTFLANHVNTVEVLYYNVNSYQRIVEIYDHYLNELDKIRQHVDTTKDFSSDEERDLFDNYVARMKYQRNSIDLVVRGTVRDLFTPLALQDSWEQMQIKNLSCLPDQQYIFPRQISLSQIQDLSTELKGNEWLLKGAQRSLIGTYFDFLTLNTSSTTQLGVGSVYRFRAAKSQVRSMEIQLEKSKADLRIAQVKIEVEKAIGRKLLQNVFDAKTAINAMPKKALELHISSKEPLSLDRITRYMDAAIASDINMTLADLLYHVVIANQERLTWSKPIYQEILHTQGGSYVPTEVFSVFNSNGRKHRHDVEGNSKNEEIFREVDSRLNSI